MQRAGARWVLALLLAAPPTLLEAKRVVSAPAKVVQLLTELKSNIEADGAEEQKTYDKYACWCESTLGRKAGDIGSAKDTAESLQTSIIKLKGDLGAHAAEIQQLKKDIEANLESQKSATEMRDREYDAFEGEKTESEQGIGALEAAIRVLTNAGAKKDGFLETMQEAQVLSVVAGVRGLLGDPTVTQSVSDQDLSVVRRFVEKPEDFIGSRAGVLSAAQIANNPFGDYAPQSTQIQGILKGMYNAFASNLERSNAEEAGRQKAFEELSATKKAELLTLHETLRKQTLDDATKTKSLADKKKVLDDTRAQIAADEKFFSEARTSCRAKAGEWAERTRLRTQELHGIAAAVSILTSPEAQKLLGTGGEAPPSFLQMRMNWNQRGAKAAQRLHTLAKQYHSVNLAKLSSRVQAGGHFDAVITSIEKMTEVLRAEEQDDIQHRDRCQGSITKNTQSMEDLKTAIDKATKTIERMTDDATNLKTKIGSLETDIAATKADIEALITLRSKEHDDFLKAQKDGAGAVELLAQAMVTLSAFFKENKIDLGLLAVRKDPVEQAPEIWSEAGNYRGRQAENKGIIAMLAMIKEDLEKDLGAGSADEESAQKVFVQDRQGLQSTLDAQADGKLATETQLAALQGKIADGNREKDRRSADLVGEESTEAALKKDCDWIETHFQTRRDSRKKEIQGLGDAKSYLAGLDGGSV